MAISGETDFDYDDMIANYFASQNQPPISVPLLKQTPAPRKNLRNKDPFDFFGTLFTTPGTQELNPMVLLNSTI